MVLYWSFVGIGIALLVWFIAEKCKGYTVKATVIKSLVSVFFMLVAFWVAYQVQYVAPLWPLAFLMLPALLFGLLGDIWLDLKYVHRSDECMYTYAGFSVFLVMHLILIGSFVVLYGQVVPWWYTVLPLALGYLIGVGNVLIGPKMKLDYTGYKGITMVYGGTLIGAALLCLSYCISSGFQTMYWVVMLIAYVLFLISDLILSQTYFAGKEGKGFIASNYITYYAAMYMMASAALTLV